MFPDEEEYLNEVKNFFSSFSIILVSLGDGVFRFKAIRNGMTDENETFNRDLSFFLHDVGFTHYFVSRLSDTTSKFNPEDRYSYVEVNHISERNVAIPNMQHFFDKFYIVEKRGVIRPHSSTICGMPHFFTQRDLAKLNARYKENYGYITGYVDAGDDFIYRLTNFQLAAVFCRKKHRHTQGCAVSTKVNGNYFFTLPSELIDEIMSYINPLSYFKLRIFNCQDFILFRHMYSLQ